MNKIDLLIPLNFFQSDWTYIYICNYICMYIHNIYIYSNFGRKWVSGMESWVPTSFVLKTGWFMYVYTLNVWRPLRLVLFRGDRNQLWARSLLDNYEQCWQIDTSQAKLFPLVHTTGQCWRFYGVLTIVLWTSRFSPPTSLLVAWFRNFFCLEHQSLCDCS